MCIIIVNEKGKLIKDETLVKSAVINPHGLGITWLDTGVTDFYNSSDWSVLKEKKRPYIAHFRYATRGKVCEANMHPFTITGTDKVLFQNGTVSNLGNKNVTDAEHMAKILSDTNHKHWRHILEMSDCRWVIVDTKTKEVTLYNKEMFIERSTVLYSKNNVLEGELVAVYGTLKRGHGNNRVMGRSKFVGEGETVNRYPMVGHGVPFVLPVKGRGHNVKVEVFMADKKTLEGPIDSLESHPNWYRREKTLIRMDDGNFINAWLYFNPTVDVNNYKEEDFMSEYVGRTYSSSLSHYAGYNRPNDAGLAVWHTDNGSSTGDLTDEELGLSDNLDGACCDTCGGFETQWDDTSDALWCWECQCYVTSQDVIYVDTNGNEINKEGSQRGFPF